MTTEKPPLVSCICLSHNRVELLQRSVQCYRDQTYSNKELIVAFNAGNVAASNFIAELNDASIKSLAFQTGTNISLGEKRNMAIEFASGFYFCIWDDDDWHNMSRLETQVKSLAGTQFRSSILSNIILFDGKNEECYVSAMRWGWEQSLLCEKSLLDTFKLRYVSRNRGEDSALVCNLREMGLLLTMTSPELYVYVYHGDNVFHRGHWEVNLLPWAKKMSPEGASIVRKILKGSLLNPFASEALAKAL
jgi:glycosyltransferase involved in cell wall biosynthesis